MIVICTHKSTSILDRIVSSIRKYSLENHRVLIVETSDNMESKEIADKYDCLFTNSKLKYEIGAYNHAMELYPDEDEYFMFQDSVEIIQFNWENSYRNLSKGIKMVSMSCYLLREDPCPGCGEDLFKQLYGLKFPVDEAYAVACNCFYIPAEGKKLIQAFGINKLVAENKNDTYATERILGAIAYYTCGFEDVSTELGNWEWNGQKYISNTGFTKYVYKHMLHRQ